MHQFFVEDENIGTEYITITGSDVNHIRNVLRMKPGEKVRISNGSGRDFFGIIEGLREEAVEVKITEEEAEGTELPN